MESLRLKLDRPEWDEDLSEAYKRAEEYLRAYGITNRRLLFEVTYAIVARVSQRMAEGDSRHPVEITIDLLEAQIALWCGGVLKDNEVALSLDIHSRVSLFRAHLSHRWKNHFLRVDEVPDSLTEELKKSALKSQPEREDSGDIHPQSIDLGAVGKIAEDTWSLFGRIPVLGVISMGIGYVSLIAFILYFLS